jgi:FkbM family methyltransferase
MNEKITNFESSLFPEKESETEYKLVQGGNVPGGHNCIKSPSGKYFITPMRECNSIPLRHSDVVVDIGAYVGTYAIRCARFPVKKVIAYEPTPESFEVLSKVKLPNLKLRNKAIVGDDRKKVKLFISKGVGVTNSIVKSKRKKGFVEIGAVNYLKAIEKATIVKIDIEGGEYDLPIIQPQLRAIIIDFHPMPGDWIGKANKIISNLKKAGYKTVIKPDFSCGWTQAGSWIKPMKTKGRCKSLMSGLFCCGCGTSIIAKEKALCPDCHELWGKKYNSGFALGELKNES